MLEFKFTQNYYVQDPLYKIIHNGNLIGTIEYDGMGWAVQSIHHPWALTSEDFMQIANKLDEINASLRKQRRWFKW